MSEVQGVQIRERLSASNLFHRILWQVNGQFEVLQRESGLTENPREFKQDYVEQVPRFEAVRLSSPARKNIARALINELNQQLVFIEGDQEHPLLEYLSAPAEPAPLRFAAGGRHEDWDFELSYAGQVFHAPGVLGQHLLSDHVINAGAVASLSWIEQQMAGDAAFNLDDRKIVVIGAAAEMAATRLFLDLGADVLWLDMAAPSDAFTNGQTRGSLSWPEQPLDLLTAPRQVLATIAEFAGGRPVDLCLYAYAPGQARELRLTGVMNALVDCLPAESVRSVTLLVSPTTASSLDPQDLRDIESREANAPGWEKALATMGLLGDAGVATHGDAAVVRTLVGIQGASYQAAQYLGKVIMAEVWSSRGEGRLRVSANTAAITQTRSLDHPVFDAAFGGARAMQVETFTPLQSQTVNGLLAIADWLQEEEPVPGNVRVHGGIHLLPYPLDKALRIAAAIGFARSPVLLLRWLGSLGR